jgi:hypothetical protein
MTFEIRLSNEDRERLFAIKHLQGRDDLSGGDFASELLSRELHRLFPGKPERDENGEVMNRELYRGR